MKKKTYRGCIYMVRFNTNLPEELFNKLKKESNETGVPMKYIVISALREYYKQQDTILAMPELLKMMEEIKLKEDK